MIKLEELADGILQIHCRGALTPDTWHGIEETVQRALIERHDAVYVLLNMSAVTTVDPMAFGALITATTFDDTAFTLMVARRAHIHLAREILSTYPDRDRVQIRMLPRLDEAFRVLLDKQAMDRMNGARQFGH